MVLNNRLTDFNIKRVDFLKFQSILGENSMLMQLKFVLLTIVFALKRRFFDF